MARKGSPEIEMENNDATNASAPHVAPAASLQAALNNLPTNNGGAQFSFVDPSVMMVTNAAATIAAVAASAVQQMAKGNPTHSAGGGPSPVPAGLAGAFQGSTTRSLLSSPAAVLASAPATVTQLHPHVAAALLGAGTTQPSLSSLLVGQNAAPTPSPSPAHVHAALPSTKVDTSATLTGRTGSHAYPPHAAVAAMSSGSINNVVVPGMQNWSLEQLEQHANLLHKMNLPVPQSVALLLADARRKENKRTAKRVANRKSACTSRARKKALVEEMTRTNARLRRQALILALLPDLVIAITVDGRITFCSAQAERMLQYKIDDLIGSKLQDLLVPASKEALQSLIKQLTGSGKGSSPEESHQEQQGSKRRRSGGRNSGDTAESKGTEEDGNANSKASGRGSSRSGDHSGSSAAAVVSEQSFPLSVVEVESKRSAARENNSTSDALSSNSAGKQQAVSSLTNSTNVSRSPTDSFSGEDDGARRSSQDDHAAKTKRLPSSDDSSSLSSDAKNVRKANDNLERNVRWHNQRMKGDTSKVKTSYGPKDDVTGASVTKNNATARLSSLKHVPEQAKRKEEKSSRYESNGDQSSSDDSLLAGVEEKKKGENNSDDSGYRESNDSREETSSSGSDTSNSNGHRKKPLAPTCKVCLIRDDLTTVWCEVTSSIRTRTLEEDIPDTLSTEVSSSAVKSAAAPPTSSDNPSPSGPKEDPVKELLLCLRPIRDGEKKVDESLRFKPRNMEIQKSSELGDVAEGAAVSSSSGDRMQIDNASRGNSAGSASTELSKRPPKKRPPPPREASDPTEDGVAPSPTKRKRQSEQGPPQASDTEKSVVESLMLMSNKSQ